MGRSEEGIADDAMLGCLESCAAMSFFFVHNAVGLIVVVSVGHVLVRCVNVILMRWM